jgi:DNA repair protein RadD
MGISPRPYQAKIVDEFEQLPDGQRTIIVAPTGSGKTAVAAEITRRRVERHRRVLFVAHRREIVLQTRDKLAANGVFAGVIMAGESLRPLQQTQVASIQTLHARAIRSDAMPMPDADLLIIDECHHGRSNTYQNVIRRYKGASVLGLTATPCRGDGRGLGNIFTSMIECPQVAELIAQGYFVKSKVYAPVDPDLKGVKVTKGDYSESQLSNRMNTNKLVGDIVTHWHKYGERRKTVVFAVDVRHSVHIANEFVKAGVRAEHLDGSTPTKDRDAILGRLASGETEVVSNCMVLTEGWDMPAIGCLILARPTKQMGLYRQMVGRALRPADGKPDAVILDHSGAVFRHGLPEDPVAWTLDQDRRATNPAHERRQNEQRSRLLECTQCSSIRTAGEPCPCCGFLPKPLPRYVPFADGDLGLVTNGRTIKGDEPYTEREFYGMCLGYFLERGKNPNAAYYRTRERFRGFSAPYSWRHDSPISPIPEVRSWLRSREIAWAKSQSRGEA